MDDKKLRKAVGDGYEDTLKRYIDYSKKGIEHWGSRVEELKVRLKEAEQALESYQADLKADEATLERIKELDFNAWYLYRVQHYDGFTENRFVKRYTTKEAAEEAARIYNLLTGAEYIVEGKNV